MNLDLKKLLLEITKVLIFKDTEDIFNKLSKIISENFRAVSSSLMAFEENRKLLRLVGTSLADKSLVRRLKIPLSKFESKDFKVFFDDELKILKCDPNNLGVIFPVIMENKMVGALFLEFNDGRYLEEFERIFEDFQEILGTLIIFLIEQTELKYENIRLKLVESLDINIIEVEKIEDIFQRFLDEVSEILEVEYTSIWYLENEEFVLKSWKGFSENEIISYIIPKDNKLIDVIYSRKPKLIIDKNSFEFLKSLLNLKFKSVILCPLHTDEKPLGLIMLANKIETKHYRPYKHLDEFELSLVANSSRKLSLLIENFINKKKLEEFIETQKGQIQKLSAVYKIIQAMNYSYDLNNIFKILLIGLISELGFGFDRALLLFRDKNKQVLRGKMWLGISEDKKDMEIYKKLKNRLSIYGDFVDYLRQEALSLDLSGYLNSSLDNIQLNYIGDDILERVVLRKTLINVQPQLIEEGKSEIYQLTKILGTSNFVCIPLIGKQEVLGVIVADNKYSQKDLSEGDIKLLKLLSGSAGLVIETRMSFLEIQEKNREIERRSNYYERLSKFTEALLNSLDAAIIVIKNDGIIIEWNRRAKEFFGKSREQVIGVHLKTLGTEFAELYDISASVYYKANKNEPDKIDESEDNIIVLNEYFLSPKYGKYFNIKFTPLRNVNKNTFDGIIIMLEDVTEHRNLTRELQQQEKLAMLGEVAARVAHEIRNPLTVIGGFTNRLKKKLNDDKSKHYLEIISDEVKRLEKILDEILEFGRDYETVEFEEFDFNTLVREILELYKDKMLEKAIKLKVEIPKEEIIIFGDKKRLKQVLINLLKNAIDETNRGKIDIKVYETSKYACFSIKNDGKPIPEELKDKIFMPFFTTKTDGTGLGLAISKKIVEDEHSGKIYLETGDNWNKFVIEIPKKGVVRKDEKKGIDSR